ncbi:hypothetical protein PTTG_26352 [Puccinia triticina 1-1 BBBD Race 1]|uniref:DUF202 domain-containing protein n=2 Tax=Puccinia triticina TaxID=208348 RepID=A0A180GVA5_PUCT1|nr:uncharacterized protein PtA15_3A173 [Puccinia triticina]OAV96298.1 hypothetical protein PTTG_26352 [Puccinia triticina 1-1 BBBD Race 1]WAQ82809.1 hypothetical protein PtA15_3A173 [Puccinia triticina]WAR53650.1 hypothetical protein PtB15_3B158 [Puccinia triticina]
MVHSTTDTTQETDERRKNVPGLTEACPIDRASTPCHHQEHEELQSPIDSQHPLNNQTQTGQTSEHWLKSWSKVLSPVAWLENKSSVARDHLANERTFLAWFRTSLSLTSIGIALVQLSRLSKQIKVAQVKKIITLVQPIIDPLSHPSFSSGNLSGLSDPSNSIQFSLNQINQNLINLQSVIDEIHENVDSIKRTKSLASVIGNCYVCIGLFFLFIGTHRYFRVQQVLQTGKFPHSRRSIGLTTFVVSALLIVTTIGMFRTTL